MDKVKDKDLIQKALRAVAHHNRLASDLDQLAATLKVCRRRNLRCLYWEIDQGCGDLERRLNKQDEKVSKILTKFGRDRRGEELLWEFLIQLSVAHNGPNHVFQTKKLGIHPRTAALVLEAPHDHYPPHYTGAEEAINVLILAAKG